MFWKRGVRESKLQSIKKGKKTRFYKICKFGFHHPEVSHSLLVSRVDWWAIPLEDFTDDDDENDEDDEDYEDYEDYEDCEDNEDHEDHEDNEDQEDQDQDEDQYEDEDQDEDESWWW